MLGNICSDFMRGGSVGTANYVWGNYYNAGSISSNISFRSLVEMRYDMKEIHQIFQEASVQKTEKQKQEISIFMLSFDNVWFTDDSELSDADKSLIYYIAVRKYFLFYTNCKQHR